MSDDWRKGYLLRCAEKVSNIQNLAGWLRRELEEYDLMDTVKAQNASKPKKKVDLNRQIDKALNGEG